MTARLSVVGSGVSVRRVSGGKAVEVRAVFTDPTLDGLTLSGFGYTLSDARRNLREQERYWRRYAARVAR